MLFRHIRYSIIHKRAQNNNINSEQHEAIFDWKTRKNCTYVCTILAKDKLSWWEVHIYEWSDSPLCSRHHIALHSLHISSQFFSQHQCTYVSMPSVVCASMHSATTWSEMQGTPSHELDTPATGVVITKMASRASERWHTTCVKTSIAGS